MLFVNHYTFVVCTRPRALQVKAFRSDLVKRLDQLNATSYEIAISSKKMDLKNDTRILPSALGVQEIHG